MRLGMCAVLIYGGGNRGVLGPDLASLLVPSDDAAALAAAWRRHLLDVELRRDMGRRARARVQSEFSLERMVENHIEIYRQLTKAAGLERQTGVTRRSHQV